MPRLSTCFSTGTGAFLLYNTGQKVVSSTHGLLSTIAYKAGPNAPVHYALEGSIAVAGSAVKWVRDSLGLIKDASEIGDLAGQVKDSGGVYFVTAFSGLFCPYWDDTATGTIVVSTQERISNVCVCVQLSAFLLPLLKLLLCSSSSITAYLIQTSRVSLDSQTRGTLLVLLSNQSVSKPRSFSMPWRRIVECL